MEAPDALPWQISRATVAGHRALHLEGHNGFASGERFAWRVDAYAFADQAFAATRYDFSQATYGPGARELLRALWPSCPALTDGAPAEAPP